MLPPDFLSAMRFERDDQAGITIRVNTIAHAVFILVSVGLCIKVMLDTPPKFPMAAALVVCAVYLIVRMLRFIRFYGLWINAYFEMGDDRARGFAADGSGTDEPVIYIKIILYLKVFFEEFFPLLVPADEHLVHFGLVFLLQVGSCSLGSSCPQEKVLPVIRVPAA